MKANIIDDEDIRILLMEDDPKTRQKAILDLYDRVAPAVTAYLRRTFFAFSDHHFEQVLNDTFIQLFKKIEAGEVDLEQPLKNLLLTIVIRRAKDLRRKLRGKRQPDVDYVEDVAATLGSSSASYDWKMRAARGEAKEIVEEFQLLIPTLPRVQRIVAEAMAGSFPIGLSLEELCDEVEHLTGTRPSIPSVKDARKHVRRKFAELL